MDKHQENIKLADFGICTKMNVSNSFLVKWCPSSLFWNKNLCYPCIITWYHRSNMPMSLISIITTPTWYQGCNRLTLTCPPLIFWVTLTFLLIWGLSESKTNLSHPNIWKETKNSTLMKYYLPKCSNIQKCFNWLQTLKTATGGLVTKNNIASFHWTSPELLTNKPFGRNTDIWYLKYRQKVCQSV